MKVKALRNFRDLKEEKNRTKDDIFEVSLERFKELNSTKHGNLVEEVEEETTEDEEVEKEVTVEGLTVTQLKDLLDQKGIKYKSKAKREELINLLEAGD